VLRDRGGKARQQAEVSNDEVGRQRAEWTVANEKAAALVASRDSALESLTKRWTSSFAVGVFNPLTPEQLCASTLRATGEWEHTVAAVEAEFDNKLAEAAKKAAEPPKQEEGGTKEEKKPEPPPLTEAGRARYLEEQCDARLKASYDKFVKLFGGQPGSPQSDFFATADQALFIENDGLVRGWLQPKGENLAARLMKIEDPASLADELYLSTVTRPPSEEEKSSVRSYLASRENEKAQAIQDLAWALISSVEFRFKH